MRRGWALVALNGLAVACYGLVAWRSGYLAHIHSSVFSSVDAGSYRDVADWIFGVRANPHASIQRPVFYPLILGLAMRVGDEYGVWLVNVALWFAALNLAGIAAYRFVHQMWATIVVFVVMATNVSLIVLTFHALTETLVLALLALWSYGLTRLTGRITPSQVAWVLLPVSLLTITKPEFELLLGLVIVVLAVLAWRGERPAMAAVAIVLCLSPVMVQVGLMLAFNHFVGLSKIGETTIRTYYMARLYAALAHSSDIRAQALLTANLSNIAVVQALLAHPGEALSMFLRILRENLTSGSNFITASNPLLGKAVFFTNYVYAAALIVAAPLAAVALWLKRDGRLALLAAAALNVMVAGGLSFWQGDRLTVIALPVWLLALTLAAAQILSRTQKAAA